jgi:ribosome-binding factor A
MSRRTNRLEEGIREEVAKIIAEDLKDPRIGFVTVTGVHLTPDLRQARINVGVLGDQAARDKSLAGLRQAAGFVRRELGRRLRIRHTPEVAFQYDKGLDATERVARLLDEVAAEEVPADPEPGEDD